MQKKELLSNQLPWFSFLPLQEEILLPPKSSCHVSLDKKKKVPTVGTPGPTITVNSYATACKGDALKSNTVQKISKAFQEEKHT